MNSTAIVETNITLRFLTFFWEKFSDRQKMRRMGEGVEFYEMKHKTM